MDATGDYVEVWNSYGGQDGFNSGIYAQRYNAAGTAQGIEFKVNTYTTSYQFTPAVAMDAAGDFVIAWVSVSQDGDSLGVYAQRYNAAGAAQGIEFKVNTFTTGDQKAPTVAMDSAGDFVIAWQSRFQDGSSYGIYAQRYNATGATQGIEFKVNTYTTSEQTLPCMAMDATGDFVIAWQSLGQDGANYGIYAQRYNAAGAAQGIEFLVNTYTTNNQYFPSVAMDAAGDFVIAWTSTNQDGDGLGVNAQRYNATGSAQGLEFNVNAYTTHDQSFPAVAMDVAGEFEIT